MGWDGTYKSVLWWSWEGMYSVGGDDHGYKAFLCLVGLAGGVSCHLIMREDENIELGSKKPWSFPLKPNLRI